MRSAPPRLTLRATVVLLLRGSTHAQPMVPAAGRFPPPPPQAASCDPTSFEYVDKVLSAVSAHGTCRAQGGAIASIHDEIEVQHLFDIIPVDDQHRAGTWIGLFDSNPNGCIRGDRVWSWADGTELTNPIAGLPRGRNEAECEKSCTYIAGDGHTLRTGDCTDAKSFICGFCDAGDGTDWLYVERAEIHLREVGWMHGMDAYLHAECLQIQGHFQRHTDCLDAAGALLGVGPHQCGLLFSEGANECFIDRQAGCAFVHDSALAAKADIVANTVVRPTPGADLTNGGVWVLEFFGAQGRSGGGNKIPPLGPPPAPEPSSSSAESCDVSTLSELFSRITTTCCPGDMCQDAPPPVCTQVCADTLLQDWMGSPCERAMQDMPGNTLTQFVEICRDAYGHR